MCEKAAFNLEAGRSHVFDGTECGSRTSLSTAVSRPHWTWLVCLSDLSFEHHLVLYIYFHHGRRRRHLVQYGYKEVLSGDRNVFLCEDNINNNNPALCFQAILDLTCLEIPFEHRLLLFLRPPYLYLA